MRRLCRSALVTLESKKALLSFILGFSILALLSPANAQYLLIGSFGTGRIRRYDASTGAFKDIFAPAGHLEAVEGLTIGPDGNLYVSDYRHADSYGAIQRYNGVTGDFIDDFTLSMPWPGQMTFGPDGNLYVASLTGNLVK